MKTLICIPTYNEAENIKKILLTIFDLKLKDVDILVIDDNSPDGTSQIVKKIAKNNKGNKVFVLDRKKKEGLGKAYVAGFKWALDGKYQRIISMDADFSHDPKYLPIMLEKSKDYDLVIGSRYIKGGKIVGWQWHRYVNSYGANFFTRLILLLKPKDATAGFKCYSSDFLNSINLDKIIAGGYAFQVEMVNLAQEEDCKITEFPITFVDRQVGESKISGELSRSIKTVFQLALRKKLYRQIIKFGVVGFIGTIIDLGFYNLFAIGLAANIYASRIISFTLAATSNYFLNRIWTFRSKEKRVARQFTQFFFISVIGLLMNLVIMKLLESVVAPIESEFLRKNTPVLIAIVIVLFWNFFANKYWTFKEKK